MKMTKSKASIIIYSVLCVVLALCIGFISVSQLIARATQPKTYVEDIRIYEVEEDDDSASRAKSWFEKNGYVYTGINLNAGTKTDSEAYLGYKTTTNRDMAITDIRMMAMDTGYTIYNYTDMMNYIASQKAGTAQTMYSAAVAFADNYRAGSPKAIDAYNGLNLFNVGDDKKTKLGDYLLAGKADVKFFTKMIMKSTTGTMNAVHGFLSNGIAPYKNDVDEKGKIITTNWAQFTVRSDLWEYINDENLTTDEINDLHKDFNDQARELFKTIQEFATYYENAKERQVLGENELPEGKTMEKAAEAMDDVEREDCDFLYLAAYDMLNEYELSDGTKLGDWFIDLGKMNSDAVDLMQLYPVVEAMGDCQSAITNSGGFVSAVLNLSENEHNEDFGKNLEEVKEEIKDLTDETSFNIWENCDGDLENSTIAFTSDSVRKSTAENALGRKSKWEKKKELIEQIEKYANLIVGILFVVVPVMQFVLTMAVVITKLMAATCVVMAALNTLCVWLLAVAAFLNSVLPFISIVVMLATITAVVTIWIKEAVMGDKIHIDKQSDKPNIIFDAQDKAKETLDIKYKSVLNDSGKVSDINCGEQVYWCLLAYTKDDQIGSPICADEAGNIFKSVNGNAAAMNGYDCVQFFGERSAADCNAFCKKNTLNGIYLYYRTENSIAEENVEPKETQPSDDKKEQTETEEKNYISDLIVCTGKNAAEAKAKVVRHEGKYYVYDYNLSPDCTQATYLGYTMTTDRDKAITDLRVAPYVGVSQSTDNVFLGDIQYTRIDMLGAYVTYGDEKTKPQADCLYYTNDKNAGEPILADGLHAVTKVSDIQNGWEPVSVFSGMPYDFNTSIINNDYADPTEVAWLDDQIVTDVSGYMSEEDETDALNKHRTVNLYVESDKMYTSGTKYLSGLFFIGGYDSFDAAWIHSEKEQYISDFKDHIKKQYRVGVCDTNLLESLYVAKYVCWNHMQSYLAYTWSYSPKRALYNVEAYQGDNLSLALNYTMTKTNDNAAMQNYVSVTCLYQQDFGLGNARFIRSTNNYVNAYGSGIGCYNFEKCIYDDGYTDKLPENIKFGYKKIQFLPTGLYVTGYQKGGRVLTLDDVVFSTKAYTADGANGKLSLDIASEKTLAGNAAKGAFHAVSEMKNPRNKKPFNLSTPDYYYDGDFRASGGSFYIYLSGTKYSKRKYISSLSVGAFSRSDYKKVNPNASDDEMKAVDLMVEGTAMAGATSGCSDEVIVFNAATDDQSNAWYNLIEDEDDDIAYRKPAENKPAAYIGVSRTDVKGNGDDDKSKSKAEKEGEKVEKQRPITGVLLYKLNDSTSPNVLEIDSIKYYCAGTSTPIVMKGTKYFLYYSYSKGAFPGEPIEEIAIDNIPIISGYSTNVCADKNSTAPYGNPDQTNFIHLKYEFDPRKDFFNKIYIGTGSSSRAAQCDLLTQGCMEYIDLDASIGVKKKSAYIGFRRGHLDLEKIDSKNTESAKEKERANQLREAIYDVIITNDEPYKSGGIVINNMFYQPVGNKDLTNGMGHRLYMYYATPWYSSRYNSNNGTGTYLPQDVYSGFITSFALARYDRVPYNTLLASTMNNQNSVKPWEYVMLSDGSRPAELNEGTISFDTSDSYSHFAKDNRITMFAQRSDGSTKSAGEITGGFVAKNMEVGNGYIDN